MATTFDLASDNQFYASAQEPKTWLVIQVGAGKAEVVTAPSDRSAVGVFAGVEPYSPVFLNWHKSALGWAAVFKVEGVRYVVEPTPETRANLVPDLSGREPE